jgi:uncharacterized membrane protein YbaN (DUF454 family)
LHLGLGDIGVFLAFLAVTSLREGFLHLGLGDLGVFLAFLAVTFLREGFCILGTPYSSQRKNRFRHYAQNDF